MAMTVIVPTDGTWNRAPETMPEEGAWCLILYNIFPQIAFANPSEFSGWVMTLGRKAGRENIEFEVFADFSDEIYWAPLPQLQELRIRRQGEG